LAKALGHKSLMRAEMSINAMWMRSRFSAPERLQRMPGGDATAMRVGEGSAFAAHPTVPLPSWEG